MLSKIQFCIKKLILVLSNIYKQYLADPGLWYQKYLTFSSNVIKINKITVRL